MTRDPMNWSAEALQQLQQAADVAPLPRVRRLHLPPPPAPDRLRGEFCALELDDGALGVAYVLLADTLEVLRRGGVALEGADPLALARDFGRGNLLRRTLAFAAITALTRSVFDRAGFVPPRSTDSTGQLAPEPGETVGMIGHFTPLIGRLVARGAKLLIVELREDLVRDDGTVRVTTDPRELAACRQILATGTLMLNDSLDATLAHCRHAGRLVLLGPSVGVPPDPLFARGVTLIGGHWVADGAGFTDALQRGEPTNPFAWKYALAPADYPGWSALQSRA